MRYLLYVAMPDHNTIPAGFLYLFWAELGRQQRFGLRMDFSGRYAGEG